MGLEEERWERTFLVKVPRVAELELPVAAAGGFGWLLDEVEFAGEEEVPWEALGGDDEGVVLPTVAIAVDNADIAEAGGVATFTATLSAAATADVTVDLGITGTATAGDDYTASGNQIVIATGATSGSITVTAVDDAIDDDAETVVVDITTVTGAAEAGEQQATTTID